MSDLREVFAGKARPQMDDAHTAKMYSVYSKRAEMVNSLLSLAIVLTVFAVAASIGCMVAAVIWVWRVLV